MFIALDEGGNFVVLPGEKEYFDSSRMIGCRWRFKKILQDYDLNTDKITEIQRDDYGRITRVLICVSEKVQLRQFENMPSPGKTLREVITQSNKKIIIVRNIVSGYKYKITNANYYRWYINTKGINPRYFKGFYSNGDPNKFSCYESEIYYSDKKHWIVEWER